MTSQMIITATEFKAKCLKILDQVHETGETVQVTKRGKVVAEIHAAQTRKHKPPGYAKGLVTIVGDIIEPVDIEWEAMEGAGGPL